MLMCLDYFELIGIAYIVKGEPFQPFILLRHAWISQNLRNVRCPLQTRIQFSTGESLVNSLLGLNV